MEKTRFSVDGVELVGDLHIAPGAAAKRPAVAIIGPMTYQKEQAPTQYARRLAALGFAALAYDSRYRGESGGAPRAWENPAHKVEDLKAAIAHLKTRDDVDAERVFVLAICQGASEALRAVADLGSETRGLASIAGHYRDPEGDVEWLGAEGLAARKARGAAARAAFEATGEVACVKAVDQTDMGVGMPGDFVWEWYQPWADRGRWENLYPLMSDADLFEYESISAARRLSTPWLMIHGENCFLPSAARRHMAALPEATKTKTVWDATPHLAYYDRPATIDRAVEEVAAWFKAA
ncbi:MAG: alpha/beta fold hydrolase [Pseudomonadota bacterium]